jgi:hypothetical protein
VALCLRDHDFDLDQEVASGQRRDAAAVDRKAAALDK